MGNGDVAPYGNAPCRVKVTELMDGDVASKRQVAWMENIGLGKQDNLLAAGSGKAMQSEIPQTERHGTFAIAEIPQDQR